MSKKIHFVDTSVFVELLNIPGMNDAHEEFTLEYHMLTQDEDMFVLPVATLIETGNHIAHIPDGGKRWEIANKFSDIVGKALLAEGNWSVIPQISTEILENILNSFPTQATGATGFGDVSIIEQFEDYWKNKQPIGEMRIWSRDHHLQSYIHIGGLTRRRDR